jgi:hypothetical protein
LAYSQNTLELSRRALLYEALLEKFICQSVEGGNGIQVTKFGHLGPISNRM